MPVLLSNHLLWNSLSANQFNKDLNNLQFKHSNKSHSPPSPLCLLEEWKVTSHWNSPRNYFICLLLLVRLHIEFKWVKEKEQWLHTSTICKKWRRVPIPSQNTKSYTWLQKLAHIMSKRAKIKHYLYEILYQFSLHNGIRSTSHYRVLHKRKAVARKSPSSIQNKHYFQLDNLQTK